MNIKILGFAFVVPFLAACAVETEVGTGDPALVTASAEDTCGAAAFQQFVGQNSPQISIVTNAPVRHYRSSEAVIQNFDATRINFEYDRRGDLVKVSCG